MKLFTAATSAVKRWSLNLRELRGGRAGMAWLGGGGWLGAATSGRLWRHFPAGDPEPPQIRSAAAAMMIPAVARAVDIYTGAVGQMPLDDYRGVEPLRRPRLLERPDPWSGRAWFVKQHVVDYLLNGNAVHYVTARDADGFPSAVTWVPAEWLWIGWHPEMRGAVQYLFEGVELPTENVVHVRRGADRWCPWRGVGVVEQHYPTLDRIAGEGEYQRQVLSSSAVPSVAVITPNPRLGEDSAKAAKQKWLEEFAGPRREPAILPAGTQVIPLGWSPSDQQMEQARRLSMLDVAHMFNLDGYFLGAPTTSLTYQSPGPNYIKLVRESIEPVLADFEDEWSMFWLPRGHRLRFDRLQLTRDDFATTVDTLKTAMEAGLLSPEEARLYLALPSLVERPPSVTSPVETVDEPRQLGPGARLPVPAG